MNSFSRFPCLHRQVSAGGLCRWQRALPWVAAGCSIPRRRPRHHGRGGRRAGRPLRGPDGPHDRHTCVKNGQKRRGADVFSRCPMGGKTANGRLCALDRDVRKEQLTLFPGRGPGSCASSPQKGSAVLRGPSPRRHLPLLHPRRLSPPLLCADTRHLQTKRVVTLEIGCALKSARTKMCTERNEKGFKNHSINKANRLHKNRRLQRSK